MYQSKKRPTFLTVLCILSFIAGAITILSSVYSYCTIDKTVATTQHALAQLEENGMDEGIIYNMTVKAIEKIAIFSENIEILTILAILFALATLFGAYMMFTLQKKGFFVYCIASLLALCPSIYLFGLRDSIMAIVITGIFVFLYSLNLKHLK